MLPVDRGTTQPNKSLDDTQPNPIGPGGKKNFPRGLPILIALALVVVGILGGYGSGMGVRYAIEKTAVHGEVADQFERGQQAAAAGQYENAQQYFKYVIDHDPNYPGIKTAMADLLLRMQLTPTATYTQTAVVSPTADTRSQQEQFQNAQALLAAGKWNDALAALDSLRRSAPDYQTAQVDGMYYTALYQRAYYEVRPPDDCHNTNLNAAIIDYTQAEHFGPLDNVAKSLRTYARLYIAGSSYWDQDWKQAQDLFGQVKAAYPTLMDSSCMTATERWRQATIKYAQELADQGDMCRASDQYQAAFSVNSPDNQNYFPAATEAANQCQGSSNPDVQPTVEAPTPTLTPTAGSPAETPTTGV